jgi:hypothetical protein
VVTNQSGQPVAGVLLRPSSGSSAITDSNGAFTLGFVPNSNFTVTPQKTNLVFVPGARSFSGLAGSITNQNFLATPTIAPSLSFQILGSNCVISWPGTPGVTYQPYTSVDLLAWAPYGSPIVGTNGVMQWTIPVGPEQAKYFKIQANN